LQILRCLQGILAIPDWSTFTTAAAACYHTASMDNSGTLPNYIPILAKVNPEQFGVCKCNTTHDTTTPQHHNTRHSNALWYMYTQQQ